jgi:CRISPR-associated protein Csd2
MSESISTFSPSSILSNPFTKIGAITSAIVPLRFAETAAGSFDIQKINTQSDSAKTANNANSTLEEYRKKDESLPHDKKRTMGRKQFIPYGLYMVHGYVSCAEAKKTGFSERDLQYLFESILNMYNYSSSATKAGMTVLSPIIIFKHVGHHDTHDAADRAREAMLGCAPAYKLHQLIEITKRDDVEYPRDYTDYDISINLSNLPNGVEIGFKYMPFEPIVWGAPNDGWLKTK